MFYVLNKSPKSATILVYGDIGPSWFGEGVTAKDFAKTLASVGAVDEVTVRINSYGGSMHDGLAIYALLAEHDARVIAQVDSIAASAASLIAMAGDEIRVAEAGQIMIHEAATIAGGNSEEMRRAADFLDMASQQAAELYAARIGGDMTADKVREKMKAETWFTAKGAVAFGLATAVIPNKAPEDAPEDARNAANVTKLSFKNKPNGEQISPARQAALNAFARGQVAISLSRSAVSRIPKPEAA